MLSDRIMYGIGASAAVLLLALAARGGGRGDLEPADQAGPAAAGSSEPAPKIECDDWTGDGIECRDGAGTLYLPVADHPCSATLPTAYAP